MFAISNSTIDSLIHASMPATTFSEKGEGLLNGSSFGLVEAAIAELRPSTLNAGRNRVRYYLLPVGADKGPEVILRR